MPGRLSKLVDADLVVPGLFMGSAPQPGRYRWLGALVLCAKEFQPESAYFPGLTVLRAPLDDDPTRSVPLQEAQIAKSVGRTVARYLSAGQPVLVTCRMGWNRSGLVIGMALHAAYGMNADEIVGRIRRARGSRALSNPRFIELLKRVAG